MYALSSSHMLHAEQNVNMASMVKVICLSCNGQLIGRGRVWDYFLVGAIRGRYSMCGPKCMVFELFMSENIKNQNLNHIGLK